MNSKDALDNLHRCALAYQASNKNEWITHCRKVRNIVDKDLDRLEKLEKVIEILKRICIFEFEEETIYQQDEWSDCYIIYITQFNNGFNKEEYDLLREVFKNG